MSFAEKLKELRHGASLTQAELAKRIGIPLRTYQTYEAGVSYPKTLKYTHGLPLFIMLVPIICLVPRNGT